MSRTLQVLLVACFGLVPDVCRAAQGVPDISYQDAKSLFADGDQDYCMDGAYHARAGDKWLALVETANGWFLQEAAVSDAGKVEARSGRAHWFFKKKDVPFGPGPVTNARIEPARTANSSITATTFDFGGKHWRWVEWGSVEPGMFVLTDGARGWTTMPRESNGDQWIAPSEIEVPEQYRRKAATAAADADVDMRDEYGSGTFQIEWAGDVNHDGLLDFIAHSTEKEAWDDELWVGQETPAGTLRFKPVVGSGDACD
jgi:hypothetical protein